MLSAVICRLFTIRTYLESEVDTVKKRKDLLEKMLAIDPHAATPEEKENGITKLRYMKASLLLNLRWQ